MHPAAVRGPVARQRPTLRRISQQYLQQYSSAKQKHLLQLMCSGQGEENAQSSWTTAQPTNMPLNTLPLPSSRSQQKPSGPISVGKLLAASAATSCAGSNMRGAGEADMIQLLPTIRSLWSTVMLCGC
jgi:hypothetical protein